jgi:hypothetical protein
LFNDQPFLFFVITPFFCTRTPFFFFFFSCLIFLLDIYLEANGCIIFTWNIWWNQTCCRSSRLIFVFLYYLVNMKMNSGRMKDLDKEGIKQRDHFIFWIEGFFFIHFIEIIKTIGSIFLFFFGFLCFVFSFILWRNLYYPLIICDYLPNNQWKQAYK